MNNSDLQQQITALQQTALQLLHIGDMEGYVYADDLARLNHDIYRQMNALYGHKGKTAEEEAALCVALLMGYSASMYNNPADERKKQSILKRSWKVLEQLSDSLLKCRLLVYCYGEVYEERLAKEAHRIIDSWGKRELAKEEKDIVEALSVMEGCPYPSWEVV